MSECKVYRRQIDEAADGRSMSGDARSHVSSCRACGDELRERELLRALVGGLGKVEAPADFDFRLRARMAASKTGGGRGRFSGSRWLYGFAPVAVAACFVIVSATLYFRQAVRKNAPDAPAVASAPAPHVEQAQNPSAESQSNPDEPAAQPKSAEFASAAMRKPARDVSPRVRHARAVAPRAERRPDIAQQNTFINSVTGARVITRIPVKASAEPLRVILRDERGTGRVVPVRSVSFGSQDFLAREAAVRSSVATEVGGVW
ncbi:MAG: hypothetical protein ABW208_28070 [Pyrinomonadaceae bacterium]